MKELPTSNSYKNQTKMLVAVDCVIFGFDNEQLKLLLIKRGFEPEKGKWSLMGGFVKKNETSDLAASRILKSLTGLDNLYLEQVETFSDPNRDPVERTVSIVYFALIDTKTHDSELIKKYSASWIPLSTIPKLIFDHEKMLQSALISLRNKTLIEPIGFELLPEKFTMRQLQKLYEAILDVELDKRNFTKRVKNLDIIIQLDEKDKNSSRKGSYLFQFDKQKYELKRIQGFSFMKVGFSFKI